MSIFTETERTVKNRTADFIVSQAGLVLRETYSISRNIAFHKDSLKGMFTLEEASNHINRIVRMEVGMRY